MELSPAPPPLIFFPSKDALGLLMSLWRSSGLPLPTDLSLPGQMNVSEHQRRGPPLGGVSCSHEKFPLLSSQPLSQYLVLNKDLSET